MSDRRSIVLCGMMASLVLTSSCTLEFNDLGYDCIGVKSIQLADGGLCTETTCEGCKKGDRNSCESYRSEGAFKRGRCPHDFSCAMKKGELSENICLHTADMSRCEPEYEVLCDLRCASSCSKCEDKETCYVNLTQVEPKPVEEKECRTGERQCGEKESVEICINGKWKAMAQCVGVCEEGSCVIPNTVEQCGEKVTNCTSQSGWKGGECLDGVCVAQKCKAGYHVEEGKCVVDTLTKCGEKIIDCTSNDGWEDGECAEGSCVAQKCQVWYHVEDNKCMEDTVIKCGEELKDCMTLAGWEDGECVEGSCMATACEADFKLKDGVCEENTVNMVDENHIEFGRYEQDNNLENGAEPILWRVLKQEEDRYLLLSEYSLLGMRFYETHTDVTWETSTLRSWLNGYDGSKNAMNTDYTTDNFIHSAFSESELQMVEETTMESECNGTVDKVFLLSRSQVETLIPNAADRVSKATPYATTTKGGNGTACGEERCTWWWLCSPGEAHSSGHEVDASSGAVNTWPFVNEPDYVRPAIWLKAVVKAKSEVESDT